jgi:hypothetical protein
MPLLRMATGKDGRRWDSSITDLAAAPCRIAEELQYHPRYLMRAYPPPLAPPSQGGEMARASPFSAISVFVALVSGKALLSPPRPHGERSAAGRVRGEGADVDHTSPSSGRSSTSKACVATPPGPPLSQGGESKGPFPPNCDPAQQKRAIHNRPFTYVNTKISPRDPRPAEQTSGQIRDWVIDARNVARSLHAGTLAIKHNNSIVFEIGSTSLCNDYCDLAV